MSTPYDDRSTLSYEVSMKKLLRYFSALPAVLMLLFIFVFSSQDGPTSGSLSYRVCCALLSFTDRLFSLDLSAPVFASRAEAMQLFVRKAAHITEYFLLTLCIFLPLRVWIPRKSDTETEKGVLLRYLLPAFLLSVICAAADEFHQSFVPGRCGTPIDVLVDSIGIIIACLTLLFFRHRINRKYSTHSAHSE